MLHEENGVTYQARVISFIILEEQLASSRSFLQHEGSQVGRRDDMSTGERSQSVGRESHEELVDNV